MSIPDSPLRFFIGGVPPRSVYVNHVVGLLDITNRVPDDRREQSQEWEICFIALIAYFEAFCKDLFACAVNIRPELLRAFRAAGRETLVDAVDIVAQGDLSPVRLGSLLVERIDLGTAKTINGAYMALLKCTPFGKTDAAAFDRLLAVRNQLVHHGGIITSRFAGQHRQTIDPENVYFYSIVLNAGYFSEAYNLLMGVSGNMVRIARQRIEKLIRETSLLSTPDQQQALEWLTEWEPPGA